MCVKFVRLGLKTDARHYPSLVVPPNFGPMQDDAGVSDTGVTDTSGSTILKASNCHFLFRTTFGESSTSLTDQPGRWGKANGARAESFFVFPLNSKRRVRATRRMICAPSAYFTPCAS